MRCPVCFHENPSHATFCGRCGRSVSQAGSFNVVEPLTAASPFQDVPQAFTAATSEPPTAQSALPPPVGTNIFPPPVPHRTRGTRVGWLLIGLFLFIPGALILSARKGHHITTDWSSWSEPRSLKHSTPSTRSVRLKTDDKADAFFDLLAPNNVQVTVRRADNTVSFSGDVEQMNAVEQLGNLLDRSRSGKKPGRAFNGGEFVERSYRVTPKMSRLLTRAFSFSDVPVRAGQGEDNSHVRITASSEDMHVIDEFITDVLHGDLESETTTTHQRWERSR